MEMRPVRTGRWTDMTKLVVVLRNFANAPKNDDLVLGLVNP